MKLSIRAKIALWNACLLTSIVLAVGAFLVLQLRWQLRDDVDGRLSAGLTAIVGSLIDEQEDPGAVGPAGIADAIEELRGDARGTLPESSAVQVLDERGRVLAHFGEPARGAALVSRERMEALVAAGTPADARLATQSYRVAAEPFVLDGRRHVLLAALSLESAERTLHRVLVLLGLAGPAGVAATSVGAYVLARKALRPVERMTADAEDIGGRPRADRVAVPVAHDEVRRLAVTLNAMLDRIERRVADQHRLLADASHEMRTPLAVMRTELDVSLLVDDLTAAARAVLLSVREEIDRMARLVDDLLTLAEADETGGLELVPTMLSLREAADRATEPLEQLAAAKRVPLIVGGVDCAAWADPGRVHLALTTLVENAIKFTPPGGSVRVTTWCNGNEVGLTVADDGVGIRAADRQRLFERYYRAGAARRTAVRGSGLGLAICREVVRAHGGRIWVDSPPGGGSAFSLALPPWRTRPTGHSWPNGHDEPA